MLIREGGCTEPRAGWEVVIITARLYIRKPAEKEGREGVGWEWWEARPLHFPHQILRFLTFLEVSERFQDTRRTFLLYLNKPSG